jgi:hypothetical protein
MTKMIKMSLVAAVAVAGMTTVASAADVSYKGKLYVENLMGTTDTAGTETSSSGFEIDFDVTGTAKINDNFSAVVGIEADSDSDDTDTTKNVAAKGVTVDDAHFVYANNGLTAKFGRQAIDTPTTDGELGEGILAAYNLGNVTVAAAHHANNEIGQSTAQAGGASDGASALAVLGSAGPVNFQLWQVNVSSHSENTTLVASGKAGDVSLGLRHATSEFAATGTKDGVTTIVTAGAKAGKIGLSGALYTTDKEGAAFTTDPSSANAVELVNFKADRSTAHRYDATGIILGASIPMDSGYSAAIKYGTLDFKTSATDTKDDDASELVLQLNKKFDKALNGSVRYATYSQSVNTAGTTVDTDKTQLRADLTYKF